MSMQRSGSRSRTRAAAADQTKAAAAAATASLLSEPRLAVRAARRLSAASMRGSVGSSTQWSNSAGQGTHSKQKTS